MQKRSISIHAHRTSIAIEPEFWVVIDRAIAQSGRSKAAFITALDDERAANNSPYGLASYLRLFALNFVQKDHGENSPTI